MKEKIQMLLTIFVLLQEAQKQFKEFEDSVPTDLCDADYISQYPRNKFNDAITDSLESLWEVIGKVAKHDLSTFLPIAVNIFTDGKVVLEKEEEETPNDNPNPNEEE